MQICVVSSRPCRWLSATARPALPEKCKTRGIFMSVIAKCYIKESGIAIAQAPFKRDIGGSVK